MASAKVKVVDPVDALEQVAVLDGRRAGERVHLAVARLLEQGVRKPSAFQVVSLARDMVVAPGLAVIYRQTAIQRLATCTASYFRLFALDETWTYIGAEIAAGRCRFDFLFEHEDGQVLADELKAGRVADRGGRRLFDEQVARQLKAGAAKWGERFLGVRVLLLAAPRASFLARPDGERQPLEWGGER